MGSKASFIFAVTFGLTGCFGPELQPVTLKVAGVNGDKLTFKFAKPKNNNESVLPAFDCGFSTPVTHKDANSIRGFRVDAKIHQRRDGAVTICHLSAHEEIEDKLADL